MPRPANASPGLHVFRGAGHIDALPAFRCDPVRARRAGARHGARTPAPRDDSRCARQHDDPGSGPGHPQIVEVRPRRPTGTSRPRASHLHVVVQNKPDCSDGTESRALTSPRSTAKRIPRQVGDSCLQHAMLRFGLFSFSCPRLRYVRPTEAIAGPTASATALTARTDMQGAHHASRRKAARATAGPSRRIAHRQAARTFRN